MKALLKGLFALMVMCGISGVVWAATPMWYGDSMSGYAGAKFYDTAPESMANKAYSVALVVTVNNVTITENVNIALFTQSGIERDADLRTDDTSGNSLRVEIGTELNKTGYASTYSAKSDGTTKYLVVLTWDCNDSGSPTMTAYFDGTTTKGSTSSANVLTGLGLTINANDMWTVHEVATYEGLLTTDEISALAAADTAFLSRDITWTPTTAGTYAWDEIADWKCGEYATLTPRAGDRLTITADVATELTLAGEKTLDALTVEGASALTIGGAGGLTVSTTTTINADSDVSEGTTTLNGATIATGKTLTVGKDTALTVAANNGTIHVANGSADDHVTLTQSSVLLNTITIAENAVAQIDNSKDTPVYNVTGQGQSSVLILNHSNETSTTTNGNSFNNLTLRFPSTAKRTWIGAAIHDKKVHLWVDHSTLNDNEDEDVEIAKQSTVRISSLSGNGVLDDDDGNYRTIEIDGGADATFSGNFKVYTLKKLGDGTQTLSGVNSYAGGTTIEGGTLRLEGEGTLGSGAVTIRTNGTLEINTSATKTISNTIDGDGVIKLTGTGSMALTAAQLSGFTGTLDGAITVTVGATADVSGMTFIHGATFVLGEPVEGTVLTVAAGQEGSMTVPAGVTLKIKVVDLMQTYTTSATGAGTIELVKPDGTSFNEGDSIFGSVDGTTYTPSSEYDLTRVYTWTTASSGSTSFGSGTYTHYSTGTQLQGDSNSNWKLWCKDASSTLYTAPGNILRFTSGDYKVSTALDATFGPLTLGGLIVESGATGYGFTSTANGRTTWIGDNTIEGYVTPIIIGEDFIINRNGDMTLHGAIDIAIAKGKTLTLNSSYTVALADEASVSLRGEGTVAFGGTLDFSGKTLDLSGYTFTSEDATSIVPFGGAIAMDAHTVLHLPEPADGEHPSWKLATSATEVTMPMDSFYVGASEVPIHNALVTITAEGVLTYTVSSNVYIWSGGGTANADGSYNWADAANWTKGGNVAEAAPGEGNAVAIETADAVVIKMPPEMTTIKHLATYASGTPSENGTPSVTFIGTDETSGLTVSDDAGNFSAIEMDTDVSAITVSLGEVTLFEDVTLTVSGSTNALPFTSIEGVGGALTIKDGVLPVEEVEKIVDYAGTITFDGAELTVNTESSTRPAFPTQNQQRWIAKGTSTFSGWFNPPSGVSDMDENGDLVAEGAFIQVADGATLHLKARDLFGSNTFNADKAHIVVGEGATLSAEELSQNNAFYAGGVILKNGATVSRVQAAYRSLRFYTSRTTTNLREEFPDIKVVANATATWDGTLIRRSPIVIEVESAGVLNFTALLDGSGGEPVYKTGEGILKVTKAQSSQSGTITVMDGTLLLSDAGTLGSGAAVIEEMGTLEINNVSTTTKTVANAMSGTGTVLISGTGTTALSGSLTNVTVKVAAGATLHVPENKTIKTLDISEGGLVTFADGVSLTVDKLILGMNGTNYSANLKVANGGQVILEEDPVEGSPITPTWGYAEGVTAEDISITLYCLNYNWDNPDDPKNADEVKTLDNGLTIEDGTIVYDTTLDGKGAWMEWLFDDNTHVDSESTKNPQISTGYVPRKLTHNNNSTVSLTTDSYVKTSMGYAAKIGGLDFWLDTSDGGNLNFATDDSLVEFAVTIFATAPANPGEVLLCVGHVQNSGATLALVAGRNDNEMLLVRIPGTDEEGWQEMHSTALATMTVPNAETAFHLYTFVKYQHRIEIYLDDILWTIYETDAEVVIANGGFQLGKIVGNITASNNGPERRYIDLNDGGEPLTMVNVASSSNAAVDMLRLYNCSLTTDETHRIGEEGYAYVPTSDVYKRTLTADSEAWVTEDAWTVNTAKAALPENASRVELTVGAELDAVLTLPTTTEVSAVGATAHAKYVLESLTVNAGVADPGMLTLRAKESTTEGETTIPASCKLNEQFFQAATEKASWAVCPFRDTLR